MNVRECSDRRDSNADVTVPVLVCVRHAETWCFEGCGKEDYIVLGETLESEAISIWSPEYDTPPF